MMGRKVIIRCPHLRDQVVTITGHNGDFWAVGDLRFNKSDLRLSGVAQHTQVAPYLVFATEEEIDLAHRRQLARSIARMSEDEIAGMPLVALNAFLSVANAYRVFSDKSMEDVE